MIFVSYLPSSTKKKRQSWTPLTKLSGSAHESIAFMAGAFKFISGLSYNFGEKSLGRVERGLGSR